MKRWLKAEAFFIPFLLILSGVFAVPRYIVCLQPRRLENVELQQNLFTMRRAIDCYWMDKEHPPQSLQNLVDAGYLREIPKDPLTKSNQTWFIEREKEPSVPNTKPGIVDVRSGASGLDRSGKPYNLY